MRTLLIAAAAGLMATAALASSASAAGPTSTNVATSTAPGAKPAKGTSKMALCAQQWHAIGDSGQASYKEKAKTMKSKKGGSMSGYNAFTSECMKKK